MKTITLTQPWATLVAIGAKTLETRSWSTSYRGPLAIHAAKGFPREARDLCFEEPFRTALAGAGFYGPDDLPRGAVIAVVRLADVVPAEWIGRDEGAEHEHDFGDFSLGRHAWRLEDVTPLPEPIPAVGALGLWEWRLPTTDERPAQLAFELMRGAG